ncbi:unnamed protein product [Pleuronectes platessa]|uniref:Uncharacterized protein n=1 Tax=Pleuronectes platessa TaxID=8262 RepID=A0A9N7UTX6_PLEPL|nr:unnamed protein product [Pleuronectes platessa]
MPVEEPPPPPPPGLCHGGLTGTMATDTNRPQQWGSVRSACLSAFFSATKTLLSQENLEATGNRRERAEEIAPVQEGDEFGVHHFIFSIEL